MNPGERLSTHHRLVVLNIGIRRMGRKTRTDEKPRTKGWNLRDKIVTHFKDKMIMIANDKQLKTKMICGMR